MSRFRKKSVVIEAVQLNRDARDAIIDWLAKHGCSARYCCRSKDCPSTWLVIPTLEGDHRAESGDWIIKGIKGEFYPCKPDIFEETYDLVEGT